ncbi:MAG: hypothetical protein AB7F75_10645 [Planctomycetota bacterium]
MSNIDFTSQIQAGVTAPALMDSRASAPKEAAPSFATQPEPESEAASVNFSDEAQKASGVSATQESDIFQHEEESEDFGQQKTDTEDFAAERKKVEDEPTPYNRIDRRASINVKDGQIHLQVEREGEVKEIPSEEVLKLRQNLKQYLENRQMFKGLDFFA